MLHGRGAPDRWSTWRLGLVLGALVGAVGVFEVVQGGAASQSRLLIVVLMAGAVACYRGLPSLALALLWAASAVQVLGGIGLLDVQFAFVIVLFGCARHGALPTVWTALASVPVAYAAAIYVFVDRGYSGFSRLDRVPGFTYDTRSLLVFAFAGAISLLMPWLIGLTVRLGDRVREVRRSEQEAQELRELAEARRVEAEELASVKAEQARIARDVHDVVGHSLAVILAQAEAAALLPDHDLARIRASVATIATSARESLSEVGAVLGGAETSPSTGRFPRLIAQTMDTTPTVRLSVEGTPRPLAPDLDVVAERVVREMVTNAIKHGAEAAPITMRVSWGGRLQISVVNRVGDRSGPGSGLGVKGMRRRLASVGGTLAVDERDGWHRAVAVLPLSTG
mgnify:CR=1 FL=1